MGGRVGVTVGAGRRAQRHVGCIFDDQALPGVECTRHGEKHFAGGAGVGRGSRRHVGTVEGHQVLAGKGKAGGQVIAHGDRAAGGTTADVVDLDGVLHRVAGRHGGGGSGLALPEHRVGAGCRVFFDALVEVGASGIDAQRILQDAGAGRFDGDGGLEHLTAPQRRHIPHQRVGAADLGGEGTDELHARRQSVADDDVGEVVDRARVVDLDLVLVVVADLDQFFGRRLAESQTPVPGGARGFVIAPQVVLAVVGAAGVAAEGITVEDRAAVGVDDRSCVVDLDLDPDELWHQVGQLAHRPTNRLGTGGIGLRRGGGQRAAGAERMTDRTAVDGGDAKDGADRAGLVAGDAAAGVADALPGAELVVAHGVAHILRGFGTGTPLVPVEVPGVTALRASNAAAKAPGGVTAAIAVVHDRGGGCAAAGPAGALDAPGVHLAGVPLVAGHEDVARVVGDCLTGHTWQAGQAADLIRIAGETLPGTVGGVGVGGVEDTGIAVDAGDGAAVQAAAGDDRVVRGTQHVGADCAQSDELRGGFGADGSITYGDEGLAFHRHFVVAADAIARIGVAGQEIGGIDDGCAVRDVEVDVPTHTGGGAVARHDLDDDTELVVDLQQGCGRGPARAGHTGIQHGLRVRVKEHVDHLGLQVVGLGGGNLDARDDLGYQAQHHG